MYVSTAAFEYFDVLFLKILTVKNFSPPAEVLPLPTEGLLPVHIKIIHCIAVAAINKYFEFQNDWLKIIRIKYNCTKFCPMQMC